MLKQKTKLVQKLRILKDELGVKQRIEKSDYVKYKDEFDSYFKSIQSLESKFKKFGQFGDDLKQSTGSANENESALEYFRMTEKYLAEKIGILVHDGKHELDRVDYIDKKFYTKKVIPFTLEI